MLAQLIYLQQQHNIKVARAARESGSNLAGTCDTPEQLHDGIVLCRGVKARVRQQSLPRTPMTLQAAQHLAQFLKLPGWSAIGVVRNLAVRRHGWLLAVGDCQFHHEKKDPGVQ